MSRISDRKKAFEILFARTFYNQWDINDENLSSYSIFLINGVEKNLDKIDSIIKKNIKNWKFERISRVTKCALRIGIFEILNDDIPIPIVINEAVELAKIYGGEEDANYVQAVMSSVFREFKEQYDEFSL